MNYTSPRFRKQGGFSLIEVIIAAGILSLAIVVLTLILISSLRMWAKGSSGTAANSYVALAMRKLVLEIEEGQTAVLQNTFVDAAGVTHGAKLQVAFPYLGGSDYNKTKAGSVATYYLSGATGTETQGTYLWKLEGTTRTRLARNIKLQSLDFVVTKGRLISIKITGFDIEGTANSEDPMIHQCVKLRNG